MNIFLAFAFRDVDKPLVGYMDRLLASQFVQSKTGENLGGEMLTPVEIFAKFNELSNSLQFLIFL
jgi:hypothetical protein